ncbi:MAG: 50S ribosome-binding GTPase, partial [Polyangiaceae bacterium]|nr:50S ribosome-binding GTPase [Polyangiaceae bacterium]
PKIADYPFTTLVPQLGVIQLDQWIDVLPGESLVIADIPGLVPGASEGAGLGSRFLRHVDRTKILLHLITLDPAEDRDPIKDYETIRKELEAFNPELAQRPEVIALSKSDLPDVQEAYPELKNHFQDQGKELHIISSPTREGMKEVLRTLLEQARSSEE